MILRKKFSTPFEKMRWYWTFAFYSLPLDFLLVPGFVYAFREGLAAMSPRGQLGLLILSYFILLLPLYKDQLAHLLSASQGAQREFSELKFQFQSFSTALIALALLADLIFRLRNIGPSFQLIAIGVVVLIFPSWYSITKKMKNLDLERDVSIALSPAHLKRSEHQLFVFHVVVLVLVRLCCITTLVATLLFSENLTPFTLSFCAGTSAIALLHPTIGEFFSLCRRCGLWSHRAYQIDGFCPGCAKLALKSRKQFQSRTRFHSAREFLKKIDRGLERMAITKRRPK